VTGADWPAELDAVVAAPANHLVILENERVRVLEAVVEPGATVPLHMHRWPSVQYLTSLAHFVRRDGEGKVVLDSRAADFPMDAPATVWAEPIEPHTLENVGDREIRAIVVEIKS
jgi:mannose-6-phosphate isomerase-like protein (cupin superfamily)